MFPQFNVIESYARDFQPAPVAKPGSLSLPRTTEKQARAKFFSEILANSFIVTYFKPKTCKYSGCFASLESIPHSAVVPVRREPRAPSD
jgi:hypothetical protein